MLCRVKYRYLCLTLICGIVFISIYYWSTTRIIFRDFAYLSRPLWDISRRPNAWKVIAHYYAEGVPSERLCEYHNWTSRSSTNARQPLVIDAVIFSVELDLLEIRLRELWPTVDRFIVLEADRTFTGKPKSLLLKENADRFEWAKDKLHIDSYSGLTPLSAGESPFKNENEMRKHMNRIIASYARNGDIVICSDVDEIPSFSTVSLLKSCVGFPDNLHLQLKTYVYSFEYFFSMDDSWRAHINIYNASGFNYRHGRLSDDIMGNAGWHCTFCFRKLSDFIFKMTSYSHNDRVTRDQLLDVREVQRKICTGEDVFDMYPEVYTIRELFTKIGAIPKSTSLVDLPKYVIENKSKFRFLLPDGCVREDFKANQ